MKVMDSRFKEKYLKLQMKTGKTVTITVAGISMQPTLYEGDRITIQRRSKYNVGDILVFVYKNSMILTHRLLRIDNDCFYCKGDNAFRLEDIAYDQIIGAVIMINGKIPERWDSNEIQMSYAVNRAFVRNRYDTEITKTTIEYQEYMKYVLNEKKSDLVNSDVESLGGKCN